jgi:hypothetical protein
MVKYSRRLGSNAPRCCDHVCDDSAMRRQRFSSTSYAYSARGSRSSTERVTGSYALDRL